jgi:hypothetical protein
MESLGVPQPVGPLNSLYYSGKICADCEEALLLGEGVVVVQVVIPQTTEGRISFADFENPDGSYAYEPFIFHSHCWEVNYERLTEELEEQACEAVADPRAFRKCSACSSGLLLGEPVGLATYGLLSTSKRTPNGDPSIVFERSQVQKCLCLSCLRTLNEEVIEMWETLSYSGECSLCTYERRWRTGTPCDHEEEEEDGDT